VTARSPAKASAPLPREHGAWGLLLQPFVAAVVLTQFWTWLFLPTLSLVVLGFALKEPLVVLARQRWVWRNRNPQTAVAARWLLAELTGIVICLAFLLGQAPFAPFAALVGAALLLTLVAVWFTVKNKQRSVFLQLLSTAGLSSSALLVVLLATRALPIWAWLLWTILTLHASASILVVRARLRLKTAGRSNPLDRPRQSAFVAQLLQLLVAGSLLIVHSSPALSLPLLFSALWNSVQLYRLGNPRTLEEPLRRVGFRALTGSITHAVLVIAVFWRAAHS